MLCWAVSQAASSQGGRAWLPAQTQSLRPPQAASPRPAPRQAPGSVSTEAGPERSPPSQALPHQAPTRATEDRVPTTPPGPCLFPARTHSSASNGTSARSASVGGDSEEISAFVQSLLPKKEGGREAGPWPGQCPSSLAVPAGCPAKAVVRPGTGNPGGGLPFSGLTSWKSDPNLSRLQFTRL